VREAALLTRAKLTELGLESWVKTSGGKGLHVVVPLAPKLDYEVVKGFSQAVVQHMAKAIPQRFVAKSGPANRLGKIFIDYLRRPPRPRSQHGPGRGWASRYPYLG
jgi:bifunctional non-homologous end joining protein LigD